MTKRSFAIAGVVFAALCGRVSAGILHDVPTALEDVSALTRAASVNDHNPLTPGFPTGGFNNSGLPFVAATLFLEGAKGHSFPLTAPIIFRNFYWPPPYPESAGPQQFSSTHNGIPFGLNYGSWAGGIGGQNGFGNRNGGFGPQNPKTPGGGGVGGGGGGSLPSESSLPLSNFSNFGAQPLGISNLSFPKPLVESVPEPFSLTLLGIGALGVLVSRRRLAASAV